MSGVLGDRKMKVKTKGKVYTIVVRPALVYGGRDKCTGEVTRIEIGGCRNENATMAIGCAELRSWTKKVEETEKKVQERRLKCYGHVIRRDEHCIGRRVMEMKEHGRRKRGRPKRRWLDRVTDNIKEKGLSADTTVCHRPPIKVGIRCTGGSL